GNDEWDGSDLGPDAPTMETPWAQSDDAPTMESPWVEPDTLETPTLETAAQDTPTVETRTVEASQTAMPRSISGDTNEMPAVDPTATGEYTEEIDLNDLGLSVDDLSGLPDDIGSLPGFDASDTREQRALAADDELLSATGVTAIVQADIEDPFEMAGTEV